MHLKSEPRIILGVIIRLNLNRIRKSYCKEWLSTLKEVHRNDTTSNSVLDLCTQQNTTKDNEILDHLNATNSWSAAQNNGTICRTDAMLAYIYINNRKTYGSCCLYSKQIECRYKKGVRYDVPIRIYIYAYQTCFSRARTVAATQVRPTEPAIGIGMLKELSLSSAAWLWADCIESPLTINQGVLQKKESVGNDIQQYTWPPSQELVRPGWPGLGRAATKMAMKAAKKIASLANIVKMRVGWVFESSKSKDNAEVGYSNWGIDHNRDKSL